MLDDDALTLGVLSRILTDGGFSARTTSRPEEALRIAAEGAPDAMLVDLHLDGGDDGLDFLPRLRASGYAGPVFVLSGDETNDAAHASVCAGADGFLVKRDAGGLADRLRALLAEAGRREKAPSTFPASARAYLETRGLTAKEIELAAAFAADGANEKEIAARTGRSATAVRKGFESIRRRLGVNMQHDLARVIGILSCFGARR